MADLPAALEAAALRDSRGVDLTVWPPRYDPAYRPAPAAEHWLPEIECADPAERDALIFAKLVRQVRYAWERSPFYRRKWQEADVSPETLKSLDDLARFPVVQSYALHFAETARREGVDPRSFGLRILFFSGEPGAGIPATRALIEDTFGGRCVDMGTTAARSPTAPRARPCTLTWSGRRSP